MKVFDIKCETIGVIGKFLIPNYLQILLAISILKYNPKFLRKNQIVMIFFSAFRGTHMVAYLLTGCTSYWEEIIDLSKKHPKYFVHKVASFGYLTKDS